jgi:DNA-binding NarL/FixJ family response regulator
LLAQKGFVVCGQADNCEEAQRLAASSAADVLLIDLSLGEESGLDLIAALQNLPAKILVYSMHRDVRHIKAALAVGAHGYVTKREVASTLVEAIAAIRSGERYLSPLASQAIDTLPPEEQRSAPSRLSEREREVFRLLGEGYTAAELAEHFGISYSTVQTYFTRIMEKFGVTGAKELRRLAITFNK